MGSLRALLLGTPESRTAGALTKRTCDAARYEGDGKSWHITWEEDVPGFGLRVYPSGRRSFILRYRHAARRRYLVLGRFGVLTVQQARDRAIQSLAAISEGKDPQAERERGRSSGVNLRGLAERYQRERAGPLPGVPVYSKMPARSWSPLAQ